MGQLRVDGCGGVAGMGDIELAEWNGLPGVDPPRAR